MVDPKFAACRGKLAGIVGLIFLSGATAGALSMHFADRYWLHPQQPPVLSEAEKQMAVQHFSTEMDLNAEQARVIEEFLDELIMEQANLMQQFQNTRVSGRDRILQVLNPDQQKRFKKVLDELGTRHRD